MYKSKNKSPKKIITCVLICVGVLFLLTRCGGPEEVVTITIPEGTSFQTVAKELDKADLINSQLLFRWRNADSATKIQTGTFNIPGSANNAEIIEILTSRANSETPITIPEGKTITEIDNILATQGIINSGDLITCSKTCDINFPEQLQGLLELTPDRNIEGLLFPDTYFVNDGNFSSQAFIEQLATTFTTKIPSEFWQLSPEQQYETLKLASIIEEEVRTDPDRAIVAGIFKKRLANGWRLDADATLLYEKESRTITAKDLSENSPYNTRRNGGYPPTPISNPGLAAIKAALFPQESDYWFYLTPPNSNEVIYGRTNDEHNANRAKYL